MSPLRIDIVFACDVANSERYLTTYLDGPPENLEAIARLDEFDNGWLVSRRESSTEFAFQTVLSRTMRDCLCADCWVCPKRSAAYWIRGVEQDVIAYVTTGTIRVHLYSALYVEQLARISTEPVTSGVFGEIGSARHTDFLGTPLDTIEATRKELANAMCLCARQYIHCYDLIASSVGMRPSGDGQLVDAQILERIHAIRKNLVERVVL